MSGSNKKSFDLSMDDVIILNFIIKSSHVNNIPIKENSKGNLYNVYVGDELSVDDDNGIYHERDKIFFS
ncbi:Hypothetical predicted protein [Mytilus galloprovincialis]|uniref:Uncharacterized protein n=1 Tax=Mytilus galloprovincialis TaxID=29158 RepID=A0A8B6C1Q5_MYTGA|nr:Hypothetical predicted protein [Mytilus galloprovincialis]